MTKRKLPKYNRGRPTIQFSSRKSSLVQYFESYAELAQALKMDFDPSVDSFEAQPDTFDLICDGVERGYTPDFVVFQNGVPKYLEVKPKALESNSFLRSDLKKLKAGMFDLGHNLEVIYTDYSSIEVINLKRLSRYRDLDPFNFLYRKASFEGSIAQLLIGEKHLDVLPLVYAAMFTGKIRFDISKPLNLETVITIPCKTVLQEVSL